jgi:hypothetical protein
LKHLFFDFETMGKIVADCAMIDCAVFVADTEKMLSNKPYTMENIVDIKKLKLSVKDQVENYGWKVYDDTLQFWQSLPADVRKHVKPLSDDLTVKEFVEEFTNFLIQSGKIDYWWSRSNTFDPFLLWRLYESQKKTPTINEYLPYWRVRDIRTFIDAKLDFPKINGFVPIKNQTVWDTNFKQHNSSWDVLADVLRMQAILRAEEDLELI